jgi:hypothetical protein
MEAAFQREYSENVILDFSSESDLVGIEVLDPGTDLTPLVREYDLDPHLLDVLGKFRELIPETRRQLVLA